MSQHTCITNSPVRRASQRGRQPRSRKQFVPTKRQIIAATKLIRSAMKRTELDTTKVRVAARLLQKILGESCRCLGNTLFKQRDTITVGLKRLMADEAVCIREKKFVLAA